MTHVEWILYRLKLIAIKKNLKLTISLPEKMVSLGDFNFDFRDWNMSEGLGEAYEALLYWCAKEDLLAKLKNN
jgi:hypothetical protein